MTCQTSYFIDNFFKEMFFQQLVFYFILGRDVILWLTKKKKQ